MHLDGGLIVLQQLQLLLQFLLPLLLDALELVLIEIMRPPQSVQLMLLPVFLHLPAVEDHEPELVLRVEVSYMLQVLRSGKDVLEALLEHVLN